MEQNRSTEMYLNKHPRERKVIHPCKYVGITLGEGSKTINLLADGFNKMYYYVGEILFRDFFCNVRQ